MAPKVKVDFNALAEVVGNGKMAAKEKAELDTTEEKVGIFPFQLWLATLTRAYSDSKLYQNR